MYLSHYNLNIQPFQISADPKFLWLGEKHKEAFANLRFGIMDNSGFLLLTGDVGTGKTTLINAMLNDLSDDVVVATVLDPALEPLDFFNLVANAFEIDEKFDDKAAFLIHLTRFLHSAYDENKKALLVIDEAQRLDQSLLEEIRLLSNIEYQHTKLINIFFVGQNEFNDILLKTENRALRQRITITYNLETLTKNEVQQYISHRLKIAGQKKNIFNSDAVSKIFSSTKGYPRLINVLCDNALLTGYVKGVKKINADIIKECAKEMKITVEKTKKKYGARKKVMKWKPIESSLKPALKKAGYAVTCSCLLIVAGLLYYGSSLLFNDDNCVEKSETLQFAQENNLIEDKKEVEETINEIESKIINEATESDYTVAEVKFEGSKITIEPIQIRE